MSPTAAGINITGMMANEETAGFADMLHLDQFCFQRKEEQDDAIDACRNRQWQQKMKQFPRKGESYDYQKLN